MRYVQITQNLLNTNAIVCYFVRIGVVKGHGRHPCEWPLRSCVLSSLVERFRKRGRQQGTPHRSCDRQANGGVFSRCLSLIVLEQPTKSSPTHDLVGCEMAEVRR